MKIFKKIKLCLTCKHEDVTFLENIYGDKIIWFSRRGHTCRSTWICQKCGKVFASDILYDKEKNNIDDIKNNLYKF